MTYRLFIMDRAYSSWSLRGHLLFDPFGLTAETVHAEWPGPEFDAVLARIAPARTVPALEIEGEAAPILIWDSIAIAEELATRHPDAGHWPDDPAARAAARSLAAEMHGGFMALRKACPMNIRREYIGFEPSEAVLADVARARSLWAWAHARFGGPFLCGDRFTVADAFFLPLATRLTTYGLPIGKADRAYIDHLHRVPAFRQWRAMAYAAPRINLENELDLPSTGAFGPGATPLPARAVTDVKPVNALCPNSGKKPEADSLAEIDGVVVGYCNRFCRDKSVADAAAWPKTMAILDAARG